MVYLQQRLRWLGSFLFCDSWGKWICFTMNSYHNVFPHCRFKAMKSFDCSLEPPRPGVNINLLYMNDTRCFIILTQNWTKHYLRASPSASAESPAGLCSATLYLPQNPNELTPEEAREHGKQQQPVDLAVPYLERTSMTYSQHIHPWSPTWPEPWLCTGGTKKGKALGLAFILPKIILYIIVHYCSRDQLQNNLALALGKPLSDSGKTKGGNISIY